MENTGVNIKDSRHTVYQYRQVLCYSDKYMQYFSLYGLAGSVFTVVFQWIGQLKC